MDKQALARWRIQRDMTPEELGNVIGFTARAIQMWESGEREVPDHLAYTLAGVDAEGAMFGFTCRVSPGIGNAFIFEFRLVWRGHSTAFVIGDDGLSALANGEPLGDTFAIMKLVESRRHRVLLAARHAIGDQALPIEETLYLGIDAFVSRQGQALEEALDALAGAVGFINGNGMLVGVTRNRVIEVLEKHRPGWKFNS